MELGRNAFLLVLSVSLILALVSWVQNENFEQKKFDSRFEGEEKVLPGRDIWNVRHNFYYIKTVHYIITSFLSILKKGAHACDRKVVHSYKKNSWSW